MSGVLNPQQATFSSTLASLTGLNPNVVGAWTLAEESGGAAAQRAASGNENWLNYSAGSGPGGRFDHPEWNGNPVKAAQAIANELKTSSFYKGIAASAGKSPAAQLAAISASPWDVAHYGVSGGLTGTYKLTSGLSLPPPGAGSGGGLGGTPPPPGAALPGSQLGGSGVTPREAAAGRALQIANAPSMGFALKAAAQPLKVQADPSVASAGVSPNATGVVAEAEKYLGTPYKWGGTKPSTGFDCSGFLQYVWAQKGVSIPRTTFQQVKAGTQVPINSLQPGDAIFFNTDSANSHVGMYIGHGQFIQSPHTGDVVKISNLSDYAGLVSQARRF